MKCIDCYSTIKPLLAQEKKGPLTLLLKQTQIWTNLRTKWGRHSKCLKLLFNLQSSSHQNTGNGGLEIVYEDPKEDAQSDVMSVFSCGLNDDENRKLIADEPGRDSSKTNKNFLSRFGGNCVTSTARTTSVDEGSVSHEPPPAKFRTESEIRTEQAWLKLDEEIRDVHHLIKEFSNIVVPVRFFFPIFIGRDKG